MRSHFYALSFAAVISMPVSAQQPVLGDPCPILFGDSYKLHGLTDWRSISCFTATANLPPNVSSREYEAQPRLAAVTITELRNLTGEIRGLRAEMREYQQKLAQAKANYDTAITTTTASQEAWRAKALNDTLVSVERIPARLALDKNLRAALLSSLKEELPKDQEFIDTLRQHTNP